MIKINGSEYTEYTGKTVFDAISQMNYNTVFIAVEYNGQILPKDKYETTVLTDGDTLEVVSFVGGG